MHAFPQLVYGSLLIPSPEEIKSAFTCTFVGCDFMTPVLNIYFQLIRYVYPCWVSNHNYRTQSGQCILNLDMTFCLTFLLFQILSIVHVRQLCFNWFVLRKFWEKDALLIFCMHLLTFITCFPVFVFNSNNLLCIITFFVTFVYKNTLEIK